MRAETASRDEILALAPGGRTAWRRYLRRYRPFVPALALVITGSLTQSAALAGAALLARRVFGLIAAAGNPRLAPLGLAIAALIVGAALVSLAVRRTSLLVTKEVIRELRTELLASAYDICRPGERPSDRSWLHTAIVQDTENVDVMSNALLLCLPLLVLCACFTPILLAIAPWLTLILACFAAPIFLTNRLVGRKLRNGVRGFHASFEAFSRSVSFVLEVMDLTRLRGARELEAARHRASAEHLRITSGDMALMASGYSTAQATQLGLAVLASLLIGASAIASGRISFGDLAAFYFIFTQLNAALIALWGSAPQIMLGHQSLLRLSAVLTDRTAAPHGERLRPLLKGALQTERVSFRYGDRVILSDVNWSLAPASISALVGPNGAGKTTVAALLLGLLAPDSGQVLADGVALSGIDTDCFRRQIGFLPQEPLIFSGTVRDNIVYGFPDAPAADVEAALASADAVDVVGRLDRGLESLIGEGGNFLSGGERQRIAIARTLLNRPKLLVLDEPSNHLDAGSVRRLLHNLKVLPYRPTIVLITHDAEVAALADRVFELRDASLRELGGGARMWASQPAKTGC